LELGEGGKGKTWEKQKAKRPGRTPTGTRKFSFAKKAVGDQNWNRHAQPPRDGWLHKREKSKGKENHK